MLTDVIIRSKLICYGWKPHKIISESFMRSVMKYREC